MQPRQMQFTTMNDQQQAPRYSRVPSFKLHSGLNDNSSTAYHGAEGNVDDWNLPTIRLDKPGYNEESHFHHDASPLSPNTREGLGSRLLSTLSTTSPTAAALQRSGSVLHSRARSWAAYVPKLSANNTNTSPDKPQRQSKIFGDLFNGDSAPVQLGVPTSPSKEKNEDTEFVMEYRPTFTERPSPRNNQRKSSTTVVPVNKGGRASWFTRKPSMPVSSAPTDPKDELLNLNIQPSLFPHGPADPLSPQAFNDLLLNATSLLQRMQEEYRKKVEYISNIQPEIDAQREEVEEAETRAAHLKLQLEYIGKQYQEQKRVNEEVIMQLSMEKMKLSEAREASKTVRLVRRETDDAEAGCTDEEVYRRRKRGSAGSDSGFESDADTSSVFSAGLETPYSSRHANYTQSPQLLSLDYESPARNERFSLFSKSSHLSQQSTAYSNQGDDWSTMERLRQENQQLRMQMEAMRESLQGCIDFVGTAHTS